eukprot:CAMPEP_0170175180 /NCGR_PEP_ID=MMETSP0040_2-20121228/8311_1 /TAXON_ID=641309 /ORGANISM="Lotharella oceanica, Strain CCMP622" /LENGTH=109 /DNA_ID=CAMNT_0010417085 /DNA_START=271 /DNA_END=600 /DNA_ORIENTATION=+
MYDVHSSFAVIRPTLSPDRWFVVPTPSAPSACADPFFSVASRAPFLPSGGDAAVASPSPPCFTSTEGIRGATGQRLALLSSVLMLDLSFSLAGGGGRSSMLGISQVLQQ